MALEIKIDAEVNPPDELQFLQSPARFRSDKTRSSLSRVPTFQLPASAPSSPDNNDRTRHIQINNGELEHSPNHNNQKQNGVTTPPPDGNVRSAPSSGHTSEEEETGDLVDLNGVHAAAGRYVRRRSSAQSTSSLGAPASPSSTLQGGGGSGLPPPHQHHYHHHHHSGTLHAFPFTPSGGSSSSSTTSNGGGRRFTTSSGESLLIAKLIAGGIFLKYGSHGSPHYRFVWCDEKLNKIQWGELSPSRPISHTLPLVDLVDIKSGASTAILQRHLNSKYFHANRCISLIFVNRTLDLECVSEHEAHAWASAFHFLKTLIQRATHNSEILSSSMNHPQQQSPPQPSQLSPPPPAASSSSSSSNSATNVAAATSTLNTNMMMSILNGVNTNKSNSQPNTRAHSPDNMRSVSAQNSPNPHVRRLPVIPAHRSLPRALDLSGVVPPPSALLTISPQSPLSPASGGDVSRVVNLVDEVENITEKLKEAKDANLHLTDLVELLRAELDSAKMENAHLKAKYEPQPLPEKSGENSVNESSKGGSGSGGSGEPGADNVNVGSIPPDAHLVGGVLVDSNNVHLEPADEDEERKLEEMLEPI